MVLQCQVRAKSNYAFFCFLCLNFASYVPSFTTAKKLSINEKPTKFCVGRRERKHNRRFFFYLSKKSHKNPIFKAGNGIQHRKNSFHVLFFWHVHLDSRVREWPM